MEGELGKTGLGKRGLGKAEVWSWEVNCVPVLLPNWKMLNDCNVVVVKNTHFMRQALHLLHSL